MALPRPNSLRAVRAWLDRVASNEQRVLFIVGSPRSKRALGYCQLNQIDHVHGTADLGICLHEKARGRGHGEEAMGLLEQYGYQVLNLRKITLRVRSDNNRALAMYRRIGYREVGILVAHFCHGGTQHDVTLMEKFLS
jgi:RimJ/RimL family protein N-acetyltransferase